MSDRIVSPRSRDEELALETSLRPKQLTEYIGQDKAKEDLRIFITAAKARGEVLDHVLLYGPPGLGKTTLANIIANEMGVSIKTTSGPVIEHRGDLAAILTDLRMGDILFIDEIHRLNRAVEEILYPAMEDFALDIVTGKGAGAKSIRLSLPRFTIIGATTRYALLSTPLRDRFGHTQRLDFYDDAAMAQIVARAARILNVPTEPEAAAKIGSRSRGTPRVANRLLRRIRDYAQVEGNGEITAAVAEESLARLEVDELGLDDMDRRVIRAIIEKFDGGPVGLDTIAAAIGEEADTVMDVYEPFLLQLGFIGRTPRGRVATRLAYQHLAIPMPERSQSQQAPLFQF